MSSLLGISPLTQTHCPKNAKDFWEDPAGIWFKFRERDSHSPRIPQKISDDDTHISHQLADLLYTNWLRKPSTVWDIAPNSKQFIQRFEDKLLDYKCAFDYTDEASRIAGKADLITFINSFQKTSLADAAQTLRDCHAKLNPDGLLFIRMPDGDFQEGWQERSETQTIYTLYGFLELLWHAPCFKIVETYPLAGGVRDYLLRPIDRKPQVCIGMIAKNEQRDLPRCLTSLEGVADGIYFVDTGSTDQTLPIAQTWCEKQKDLFGWKIDHYLGASEQDTNGDWKLWDFSKARNEFVNGIEASGYDWVLWMDADDELVDRRIKNFCFLDQYIVQSVLINSDGLKWPHHRLWKTRHGIKFVGRCHEYPHWGHRSTYDHPDVYVRHHTEPTVGVENSNPRNLRILEREFKESPSPRTAFYLANTYKDSAQWVKAVDAYNARIGMGKHYEEEYWFAHLYKARCERNAGRHRDSERTLLGALSEKTDWAELWMELAFLWDRMGKHKKALGTSLISQDMPIPPTPLFRERDKYTDQPYRVASWAYEHLGRLDLAIEQALIAKDRIGGLDADWDNRIERLKNACHPGKKVTTFEVQEYAPPGAYCKEKRKSLCWHRPGAIGDVLMSLNLAKSFRAQHPSDEMVYWTHSSTAFHLEKIIREAGFDRVVTEVMGNPFDRVYNLVGYTKSPGYPHKPMQKHLLEYFAEELELTDPKWHLELSLKDVESPKVRSPYITMHVKAGWSPYKSWDYANWREVVSQLAKLNIPVVQIGGPDDPKIEGVAGSFIGESWERNLHALAFANVHMGIDSWSQNATNILWDGKRKVPGVILWGSSQVTATGYKQNRNIVLGLPCQPCFKEDPKISGMPNGICTTPPGQTYENPQHACMKGITVKRVVQEVLDAWLEAN